MIIIIIYACVVLQLKLGTRGPDMFIAYICANHVFYIYIWKETLEMCTLGIFLTSKVPWTYLPGLIHAYE